MGGIQAEFNKGQRSDAMCMSTAQTQLAPDRLDTQVREPTTTPHVTNNQVNLQTIQSTVPTVPTPYTPRGPLPRSYQWWADSLSATGLPSPLVTVGLHRHLRIVTKSQDDGQKAIICCIVPEAV